MTRQQTKPLKLLSESQWKCWEESKRYCFRWWFTSSTASKYLSSQITAQVPFDNAVLHTEAIEEDGPEYNIVSVANNSTGLADVQEDHYEALAALFSAAREEAFEDGMESEFARELVSLTRIHGDSAIETISHLIVYDKVNPEVAAEALKWLGSLGDPETYGYRRWLLERSLRCPTAIVRDGAIVGLEAMDDAHAIPYLRRAVEAEQQRTLRRCMQQVLDQLESTESCRTFSD